MRVLVAYRPNNQISGVYLSPTESFFVKDSERVKTAGDYELSDIPKSKTWEEVTEYLSGAQPRSTHYWDSVDVEADTAEEAFYEVANKNIR